MHTRSRGTGQSSDLDRRDSGGLFCGRFIGGQVRSWRLFVIKQQGAPVPRLALGCCARVVWRC